MLAFKDRFESCVEPPLCIQVTVMSLKHCHSVNCRYKLQSHDIVIEIWIFPTDIDISSTIILLVKIRPCLEVSLRFMWIRSRIMSGYFCLLFIPMRVVNYIWTRRAIRASMILVPFISFSGISIC